MDYSTVSTAIKLAKRTLVGNYTIQMDEEKNCLEFKSGENRMLIYKNPIHRTEFYKGDEPIAKFSGKSSPIEYYRFLKSLSYSIVAEGNLAKQLNCYGVSTYWK